MSRLFSMNAKMVSNLDQAMAGGEAVSKMVSTYFHDLIRAGFARKEALKLTRDYQKYIFSGGSNANGGNTK